MALKAIIFNGITGRIRRGVHAVLGRSGAGGLLPGLGYWDDTSTWDDTTNWVDA